MEPETSFSVGLVQASCQDNPQTNRDAAFSAVRSAAAKGARIICLQELYCSQYFCQVEDARLFDLAETIPGPSTEQAAALARELGVVLIVPIFEKRAAGLYHNTAVVIDASGDLLGTYRKMHIPDDPQYYEKFYFTPGDIGYQTFDTRFARIGVLICWDQWYPEAARLTALKGAEIIFFPSAIGWLPSERATLGPVQHDAWRTIQRSHAIANGVYVAVVNRVGHEGATGPGIQFWGQSFVCDPEGRVLTEGADSDDDVLVVECRRDVLEEQRRGWPFLRDRRIDSYEGITSRYLDTRPDPDDSISR